ncbi:hypothetical protein KGF56_003236 [Candida oxycetoniae]|uniref:Cyclin n=1 Tax=Candida oxycetoniae TaxID=497107 RepID=A0AAI9SW58_9ASCO|nr:uncharacterized protein KGF56_003236 [Candida oxycetoniae]KAI3403969.2 hypothetical protein KGF56_003236 [Candida oxycetoniae]
MATTFVKNIQEIPNLKPPQETFVDDPQSITEINLEDLTFDLSNGLKNVSNLHILHCIYISTVLIQFTIKLQESPILYQKYRNLQLKKWGIDTVQEIRCSSDEETEKGVDKREKLSLSSTSSSDLSDSGESSDDLKIMDEAMELSQVGFEMEDMNQLSKGSNNLLPSHDMFMFEDEDVDEIKFRKNSSILASSPPPYIPIETLLKTTDLSIDDSIQQQKQQTSAYARRLKAELAHASKSKVKHPHHYKHLLKIFNLMKLPQLTILRFLLRINQYSPKISINAYLHSIFLIYKLTIMIDLFQLTKKNSFRFVIGALRTSIKLLDDIYQKQTSFKNVVGCNSHDLLKIEIGFLYLMNFNMNLIKEDSVIAKFLQEDFVSLCKFMKSEMAEYYNEVVSQMEEGV